VARAADVSGVPLILDVPLKRRCVIVNVDPASGLPGSHLLNVIGTTRGACAGVYGTTVLPGLIRVGDPVVVEMGTKTKRAAGPHGTVFAHWRAAG